MSFIKGKELKTLPKPLGEAPAKPIEMPRKQVPVFDEQASKKDAARRLWEKKKAKKRRDD